MIEWSLLKLDRKRYFPLDMESVEAFKHCNRIFMDLMVADSPVWFVTVDVDAAAIDRINAADEKLHQIFVTLDEEEEFIKSRLENLKKYWIEKGWMFYSDNKLRRNKL